MKEHKLKTWPGEFRAVWDGLKTYEIRANDREFAQWDHLILLEYHPEPREYSGRGVRAIVTYMTDGGEWGLPDNLCVLGIRVLYKKASHA